MKRIFLVVAALVVIFALSACGGSGEQGSTTQGGESTSKQAGESTGNQQAGLEPASNKNMKLTIPKLKRVKDTTVYNAAYNDEQGYRKGVVHLQSTGFPWQEGANVYIAGHRLGYPSTGSFLIFYDLDKLGKGDKVFLTDSKGRKYTYEIYNKRVVDPTKLSVLDPVKSKNVVTLQTCTLPDYSKRLILRGELKS